MTDPLAFLRAALDARQQAAEAAAALCGCHPPAGSWLFGDEETDGRILVKDDPHPCLRRKIGRRWNGSFEGMYMAQHITANDPAAVLRRITADRKILALHDMPHECSSTDWITREHDPCSWIPQGETCDTIRALAEGYGWTALPGSASGASQEAEG